MWLNLASDKANDPKLRGPLVNVWEFVTGVSNLIDLLAILPFYLSLLIPGMSSNTRVLRVLRLARVFRVLKMGKYSQGRCCVVVTSPNVTTCEWTKTQHSRVAQGWPGATPFSKIPISGSAVPLRLFLRAICSTCKMTHNLQALTS